MRRSVLLPVFLLVLSATVAPAATATTWWEDAVVYEVFVRSFHDSDGDGIGDFRGLEEKLGYIEDLGANALWLMPVFKTTTYHGYDIVDYYAVNEELGSMEDFESLLQAARRRGLDRCFDFPFGAAVREALERGDPEPFVDAAMSRHDHQAPPAFFAPFLANHDQERILTTLGGDLDKARRAAVLLLTAPGTAFLYYGEKIGMRQGRSEGEHPSARTPMQWSASPVTAGFTTAEAPWAPIGENADPYNVAAQAGADGSLLGLYRSLIHLRQDHEELRRGDYAFFDAGPGILAFERTHGGRSVVVILNLSDEPRPVDARLLSGRYTDLLSSQSTTVADRFVMPPGKLSVLAPARATR